MVWIDYASSFDKICEGGKHKTHLCIPLRQGTARDWRGVPKFIDEPTNGLDVLTAKVVTDFLQRLREKGRTILVSTHIFSLIEKVCDRVGVIIDGKMITCDTLEAVKNGKSLENRFFDIYSAVAGER